ncbi:shikimate kinase [Sporichthya brevicatena]|uniref:shikimate kinase n=1 Tax=Sporichthya brevicatena TaxID=171442 RepID=UPI0031D5E009
MSGVRPRVVLVGPPGAGKSTVGRLVAERLALPLRDTDADVEATAGKPISEIFVDDGEAAFRALERAAVATALTTHDGVLALGGGAILAEDTRARLGEYADAGGAVVFLDVGLASATRRVGFNRDRPLLLGNPRAQLMQLMDARRSFYLEVATVTVPADGAADDVADAVLAELTARQSGPTSGPEAGA